MLGVVYCTPLGGGDVEKIIGSSLESASTLGLPPLWGEAVIILNNRNRVGPNTVTKTMAAQVLFWLSKASEWCDRQPHVHWKCGVLSC